MKWNDVPEKSASKYLNEKFDKTWSKFDVNGQGFIDTTEAFQFERQLMGTFSSLTDGIDSQQLGQVTETLQGDDLLAGFKL